MIERHTLVQIDRTIALFGLHRYKNTISESSNLHHFTIHHFAVIILGKNKIANVHHSAPTFLFLGYYFEAGSSSPSVHESLGFRRSLERAEQTTLAIAHITINLEPIVDDDQHERFHFFFSVAFYIGIIQGVL